MQDNRRKKGENAVGRHVLSILSSFDWLRMTGYIEMIRVEGCVYKTQGRLVMVSPSAGCPEFIEP